MANETEAAKGKAVPVRVLYAHGDYQPDDIVDLPEGEVAAAEKAGWADSDKTAVAYARSLRAD